MVRSQPNILREDEVLDKIKKLHLMQQGAEGIGQQVNEQKCFHGKPLFTKLYSLAELPVPQRAHQNPGDWRLDGEQNLVYWNLKSLLMWDHSWGCSFGLKINPSWCHTAALEFKLGHHGLLLPPHPNNFLQGEQMHFETREVKKYFYLEPYEMIISYCSHRTVLMEMRKLVP